MPNWKIRQGDWIDVLRTMPDASVHCVVTSPPYWGLRDYGVVGQLGLERTPEEYVARMVEGFREVRRVLRNDGTLWLNLGDSYASTPPGNKTLGVSGSSTLHGVNGESGRYRDTLSKSVQTKRSTIVGGLKPKDLCGIPWMVAFALRADGWYLRQDIIWSKPNPMPESVRDRCTKAHEYIFLLSKSERYYYDQDAIAEPSIYGSDNEARYARALTADKSLPTAERNGIRPRLSDAYKGSLPGRQDGPGQDRRSKNERSEQRTRVDINRNWDAAEEAGEITSLRNKRSVWGITTKPFPEAHFATFPPEIPETCIKAGCPENGTVLDPFNGAGTTGLVATRLGRNYIGIELNSEYITMSENRIIGDAPLFNGAAKAVVNGD
jgi:DNA modification methylase